MRSRVWSFVAGALALGAIASGGCGGGSDSQGIPCSGPEHCAAYGLVCSSTLKLCVACNTSADCGGGACVNATCQGAGGNAGSFSTGGQGGSGLAGGSGGTAGSISTGGTAGSISTGGTAGSISTGGTAGSFNAGGTPSSGGTFGVGGSSGSGGSEPICDSSTPEGISDCCPDSLYPYWCWHNYATVGHCFANGVDCSTVTVCSPEAFARACPPGDFVICESCGVNYGHCFYYEPCF